MRRHLLVTLACAVTLAVGAAWWINRPAETVQQHVDAQPVASGAQAVASKPPQAPRLPAHRMLVSPPPNAAQLQQQAAALPEGSIGQIHDELQRLALAGNAEAAFVLSDLLRLCRDFTPLPREQFETQLVDYLALARFTRDGSDFSAEMAEQMTQHYERKEASCPGVQMLALDDMVAAQRQWQERAAALGHPVALVAQADALMATYNRRADIIANAESMRPVRLQALAMLQQAAIHGHPLALARLARAHHEGDLAMRNAQAAYAYLLAYQAGPAWPEFSSADFAQALQQAARGLTPEQRAAAQAQADAIRARCCADG